MAARDTIFDLVSITLDGPSPGCKHHGGVGLMEPHDDCEECEKISDVQTDVAREIERLRCHDLADRLGTTRGMKARDGSLVRRDRLGALVGDEWASLSPGCREALITSRTVWGGVEVECSTGVLGALRRRGLVQRLGERLTGFGLLVRAHGRTA